MDAHGVAIDDHLILPHIAADRGDLGHPLDTLQRVLHVPVLERPQLVEAERVPHRASMLVLRLERVPVDLAEPRGLGPEVGYDPVRQRVGWKRRELLQDP